MKLKNKLHEIAVFGPHDRMNYGDFFKSQTICMIINFSQ